MKEKIILTWFVYSIFIVSILMAFYPLIEYRYSYTYEGPAVWFSFLTTFLSIVSFAFINFIKYEG